MKKKKKGIFSKFFGKRKRKQRAQSVDHQKQVEEILATNDGDDLIDQLYNSTNVGINENRNMQKTGFAHHNPNRISGVNNFSAIAKNSLSETDDLKTLNSNVPPKENMNIELTRQNEELEKKVAIEPPAKAKVAEVAPKPTHYRQSIRQLLTNDNSEEDQPKNVPEEQQTILEDNDNEFDTEKILKIQYEEDRDEALEKKLDDNEVKVGAISHHKPEEVVKPKAEVEDAVEKDKSWSESRPIEKGDVKKSLLHDFLDGLEDEEKEEELSDSGDVEDSLPPPVPPPKMIPIPEPQPIHKPLNPKRPKCKEFDQGNTPIQIKPMQFQKKKAQVDMKDDKVKNKDFERIVKGLSFNLEDVNHKKQNIDLEKMKDEVLSELRHEFDTNNCAKQEIDKFRTDQLEIKNLLEKERKIKHNLSLELEKLKKKVVSNTREQEKEEQNERQQAHLSYFAKFLEQNEKQLQTIHELVTQKYKTQLEVSSSLGEENKLRTVLLKEEENELNRIKSLTEQIKLEQSLIMEEEERKQAFKISEQQRLRNFVPKPCVGLHNCFVGSMHATSSGFPSSNISKKKKFNTFSQENLLEFLEQKLNSTHFYEMLKFLVSFCLILLGLGILNNSFRLGSLPLPNQSEAENKTRWIPKFSKLEFSLRNWTSLVFFQLFHTSNAELIQNISRLFKTSLIFLITDRKPILLHDILLSSYISTMLAVLLFSLFPGFSNFSGVTGLIYGVNTHVVCRGLFSTRVLEVIISVMILAMLMMNSYSVGISNIPFLVGGGISGLVTSYLASIKK